MHIGTLLQFSDFGRRLEATHTWHLHVHQDHVWRHHLAV